LIDKRLSSKSLKFCSEIPQHALHHRHKIGKLIDTVSGEQTMLQRFLLVLLVFSTSILALALDDQGNPNDPNDNDRANACYDDGSMAGKCLTDLDWEAGWYFIRFEYGLLSREEIPAQYAVLLPPLPEDENEDGVATETPPDLSGLPKADCVYLFTSVSPTGDLEPQYLDFNGGNFLPANSNVYEDAACSAVFGTWGNPTVYAPNGHADANLLCQAHGKVDASIYPMGTVVYPCTLY
jgi:hypothetical protein